MRYEGYEANRLRRRGWQVMDCDDRSTDRPDGRVVAADLTNDDCTHIVQLLNEDDAEQKRRANDDDGFRPEVM